MYYEDKIFFKPGDVVLIKLNIPFKPLMIVTRVERSLIRKNSDKGELLRGIKCRWFTENGFIQEAVFSTKDLILINNNE